MINHHRKAISGDDTSRAVIDLSGKRSRRKARISRPQAYSAIHYKPFKESPLRTAVIAAWELYLANDEEVVARFDRFLNPQHLPDKPLVKKVTFQQTYMREVVEGLDEEELKELDDYIERRWRADNVGRDAPWLDVKKGKEVQSGVMDTVPVDPSVAQNQYYQRYVCYATYIIIH